MYLPPLGEKLNQSVLNTCFQIMDQFNSSKDISRIENVEEQKLGVYRECGYTYSAKHEDYLCSRKDIAFLKGDRFKSKRSSYNYFVKHYSFEFRPYLQRDILACLDLYKNWARKRKEKFSDSLYQGMLEDGFSCQKLAMENYFELGLTGYVIEIKNKIVAYTFGFPINSKIFCQLFEVCDLTYQGIAQFIFSGVCQKLSEYEYINIMDDSGLLNLRKVKLSYHPVRIVPNYIIQKKYG